MKKIFALCLLAAMCSGTASAQVRQTHDQCMRKCQEVMPSGASAERFTKKLAAIGEQKKRETDPQKLKRLTEEEEEVMAERDDHVEDVCSDMCQDFPKQ